MQGSAHMGEGDRSSGRIASSSCCQIEFVARQGPPQLTMPYQTRAHTHTHTHPTFMISARAGRADSWASPVCLTHSSTFFLCEGILLQAKPTGEKTKTNCPLFEGKSWDLTARMEGNLHCMYLCNVQKMHYFCSSSEGTGTQSFHCLGKPPFLCTQLAPPSPYQHHEQENTPHLFSVTPSASCHSNPHREVDHINGKQSLHSSNSLCVW